MAMLQMEGRFQAEIIEAGLRTFDKSATVSVSMKFQIIAQWNHETQEWDSWADYEPTHCFGDTFIIKIDGTLSEKNVKRLQRAIDWNGDLNVFEDPEWEPPLVQIDAERDEYEGKVRYRASWLHPIDADPNETGASRGNLNPEEVKAMAAQYGGQLRALIGAGAKK